MELQMTEKSAAAIVEDTHQQRARGTNVVTPTGVSKYECELCLDSFNLYDRKPFSLVPCGHSLCIRCFDSLTKTTCPYCRASFTSKIPNWEIVKRLPKPMLPIIFYQLEIKMISLEKVIEEFSKLIVEVNLDYRKRLSELIANDENNKKSYADRLKRVEKRLDEINSGNLEVESNLRRKMDKIKSQLDTDEVKFNEESLKKMKPDIDKLNLNITERMKILRKDREDLIAIMNTPSSTPNEILARMENELRDNSAYRQVYRELNSIFAAANVVRPISNASDGPSATDSANETEEMLNCRPSQKSKPLSIDLTYYSGLKLKFLFFYLSCSGCYHINFNIHIHVVSVGHDNNR